MSKHIIGTTSLREKGMRLTSQRSLIMELMASSTDHLDAEELYLRARERDPRISLSTVYRTLTLLKNLDLVEELHLSENHHHYEPKSDKEHYHLVCLTCGRVVEFESDVAGRIADLLSAQYGFDVVSTTIDVSGYCQECQADRNDGSNGAAADEAASGEEGSSHD